LYSSIGQKTQTGSDLLVLPAAGTPPESKPVPYLEGRYNEQQGQFSPNGRWVAYASDETGSFEVYVQSFPIGAGKFRISGAGGSQPRWRRDGKELFYISAAAKLTAVAVKTAPDFEFDAPQTLFDPQIPGGSPDGFFHYDVTSDGKRILATSVALDNAVAAPNPINVIVNWTAALKR
jgi:Tol biopolymer transport system component